MKKFTILQGDWPPGGDELTPTMKLKRKPIAEKYAAEIEAMYAHSQMARWSGLVLVRTSAASSALAAWAR